MPPLILNELSFRLLPACDAPAAPNFGAAKAWMSILVDCLLAGRNLKWMSELIVSEDFRSLELSLGYEISDWVIDQRIDRDERVFFSRLVTRYPYLTRADQEVFFGRCSSAGLACCIVCDGLALSLASNEVWDNAMLPILVESLGANGLIAADAGVVRNIAQVDHWQRHAETIRKTLIHEIQTGEELVANASRAFPHLEFCQSAVEQAVQLRGTERFFGWLVSSLMDAEIEATGWNGGPFPHYRLPGPATAESRTVHEDQSLRRMRLFTTRDNRVLMFEHHMKNNAENVRVHYLFEPDRRTLMIGYVGPHLPTATY
jgi:hypothetical protein